MEKTKSADASEQMRVGSTVAVLGTIKKAGICWAEIQMGDHVPKVVLEKCEGGTIQKIWCSKRGVEKRLLMRKSRVETKIEKNEKKLTDG
jgi:hypothetical protein